MLVSAKTTFNIDQLFTACAKIVLESGKGKDSESPALQPKGKQKKQGKLC
jgi:hypothetical protein